MPTNPCTIQALKNLLITRPEMLTRLQEFSRYLNNGGAYNCEDTGVIKIAKFICEKIVGGSTLQLMFAARLINAYEEALIRSHVHFRTLLIDDLIKGERTDFESYK